MRRIASLTFVILACAFSVAGQAVNTINTVEGGGTEPTAATSAYLPQPYAAVRDTLGNTYISVPTFNTVFKVTTGGTLSVYAGTGTSGFSGDGGAATSAQLAFPEGLAVDANGNLFIADKYNNRIRRVDATTQNITTVAGSEDPFAGAYAGDNALATSARLNLPRGIAVDSHGNLFIADNGNQVVRRVDGTTQKITTYAGNPSASSAGCPSGPATGAGFADPIGIAVDANDNVFVSDQNLQIVCKIDASQNVSTYAGTLQSAGVPGQPNGDGGAATSAKLLQPNGLTADSTGNLYIADSGNPKIRKVDTTASHIITTVAGIGLICTNAQEPACGDGTAATGAEFNFPQGVFFDSLNNIVVADTDNQRVRVISSAGTITALAGGGTGGDGGAGTSGILGLSQYVVVDKNENVYTLESNGERLRELNASTKNLSTVAGDGYGGATIDCTGTTCGAANNGDGGPATQARFVFPDSVATDTSGNFYILDASTHVVRVINTQTSAITVAGVSVSAGNIATIAGNGLRCGAGGNPNATPGCGDGGKATSASLRNPFAVAVDSTGNVYIADAGLSTVRMVNSTGTISTLAGTPGQACTTYPTNCGDGGSPTSAKLNFPIGLATFNLAGINVVYIADAGDNVIRLVNPETSQITTFAFNGLPTFGGDGGSALSASMEGPSQLAIDSRGNLYVGGGSDNLVRRIDAGDGTVITVAGDVDNLGGGFSGDGGPSTSALLENYGLAIFNTSNQTDDLFTADSGSNRIRRVNLAPVTVESGSFGPFGPALAGTVNTSLQLIAFTNTGLDDLLLSVKVTGSSAFVLPNASGPGGAYIFQVSPGSTGELLVNFNPPAGTSGTLTATISITTNDAAHPTFSFPVTGTVTPPVTLTAAINPAGDGNVISTDSTIICPLSTCMGTFATGSTVTLVASGNPGFGFQSWNVANAPDASLCASDTIGVCTFTITQSESITANFTSASTSNYTITVLGLGNGSGTVTSTPAGISCTITNGVAGTTGCSAAFSQTAAPSGVMLTAGGTVFVGYLGPCTASTTNGSQCTSLPFTSTVGAVFSGPKVPFAKGQVFLDLGNMIFVLDPTAGKVVQVLKNTLALGQGMTFDSVGNLYVALQSGYLGVFSNAAAGPTAFGNYGGDNSAYSVVIDPFGNPIVSESFITGDQQPTVLQYSPAAGTTGAPSNTYYPAYDTSNVQAFWVEVLDTSDTIAYTLGGNTVKVFDLGEQLQHPDIVPNPAPTFPSLYALRELPDESLLIANGNQIVRMSQAGTILKTYTVGTSPVFQNLNLDPDGVSFWTNDELSGTVFRINIATGAVMNGAGFATSLGLGPTLITQGIGGIAVYGQPQSGGADVSVSATATPSTVAQGANLTYQITVTNNGPLAANAVTMTDALPTGATFVSATPTVGTCSGTTTVTCTLGTMNSAATATISLVVTATTSGSLMNTASVTSTTPDPNALNNSFTTTTTVGGGAAAVLAIAKSHTGNFTQGQTGATYTVTVSAAPSGGPTSGTVTMTENPPSGLTVTGLSGTGWTCTTASCTRSDGLAAGASYPAITVTVNVSAAATSPQVNSVTVSGGGSASATATDSTIINSAGGGLTLTSTTLPAGAVTVPYGADIQVTGGTPPYTFAVANGSSLPTGFTLDPTAATSSNAAPGHIHNNAPVTAGTFAFGVTVKDSTSPTPLTGNATISLTIAAMPANAQPGLLKGKYAMLLRGFNEVTGVEEAIVGSLTFDGTGNITGGTVDINSTGAGSVGILSDVAATGLYVIGADNRGVMSITPTGLTPAILAFSVGNVLNGVASTADLTSFNDSSGSGSLYAGTLRLQDPTSFNNAAFAGTYAYASSGQDPLGNRAAEIGLTTVNNANAVTSGSADANDNGFPGSVSTITGSYTTPDSNGRSLLTLTLNTTPSSVAVYQISANEVVHMTLDARATNVLLVGTAVRQTNPNTFSNASLAGPDILSLAGTAGSAGSSANIGLLTVTPGTTPTVNLTLDSDDHGTVTIGQALTGPLSIAANGRGTTTPGTSSLIFYFTQPDRGFAMTTDASVSFGTITPQVGAPFAASPFSSNLFFGLQEAVGSYNSSFSGIAPLAGSGTFDLTEDLSQVGGNLFFNANLGAMNFTVASNGHFTSAANANTGALTGYLISPFEAVLFDTSDSSSDPTPPSRPKVAIAQSIPGQVVSPVVLAPTSLTFPSQTVGTTSAPQSVVVSNTGTTAINFAGFTVTGTNAGDFAVPLPTSGTICNPAGSLAAGASCTIDVLFTPTAAGTRTGTLNVADNATGSPQTVTLTGTGAIQLGTIAISPTSLTFATQTVGTTSAAQTVTVSNTGGVNVTFSSIATTGDFAGATTAQCPSIAVEATPCTFQIMFKPTAAGTRTGAITFTDNASGSPQTVTLTGTAVNGPATVTVTPSSLTFASQPVNSTSPAQNVTVTNTGTGPATISTFSITGSNSSSFALVSGTNACAPNGTLAASASCTIGVTFTPTVTGELVATLSIADSATGSPQTVALNGTGNNSPVTISIPPGGSTTGTATPGGTAFYGLQITSAPGVTGTVQLGCTPSSPTITCTVIPSSIVLTGKPIEVAFGIQTFCQGASGTGFAPGAPGGGPAGGIGLLLFSLAFGGVAWAMQRNRRLALTFAVLMLVALGSTACGNLAKGPNGATPPGTYTLTLTTTLNGQTQTLPNFLTLVVK